MAFPFGAAVSVWGGKKILECRLTNYDFRFKKSF
jgi:hypothetical protein